MHKAEIYDNCFVLENMETDDEYRSCIRTIHDWSRDRGGIPSHEVTHNGPKMID
jgi:hypothetical protein